MQRLHDDINCLELFTDIFIILPRHFTVFIRHADLPSNGSSHLAHSGVSLGKPAATAAARRLKAAHINWMRTVRTAWRMGSASPEGSGMEETTQSGCVQQKYSSSFRRDGETHECRRGGRGETG